MKRTKAVIQKEIESIREQITKLEAESAALDYLVQVEDVVPGVAFRDKEDFIVFVVHDASPNMYRLSGNEQTHPCSLFSDAARSRAEMAQYLSQYFPNKVPGEVKFVTKPVTKAGDVLDGIQPSIKGTRLVRVYPDGTVKLFNENGVSCNSFSSLASLNKQLDGNFPMYTRRA